MAKSGGDGIDGKSFSVSVCDALKITFVENSVSTEANQLPVNVLKQHFSMVWQSLVVMGLMGNHFQ